MISVISLPPEVKYIIDILNAAGFEAFIVGGCVRDSVMGIDPRDWDVATSAAPREIKKLFKKTFDTGIKHGTVTVVINKSNFEVTTYRIDGPYADNRRPSEVFFTGDLFQDLQRRDFTINAAAYHPSAGFIDPYGGLADIKNKTIRCVGCAGERFSEDALRMLRAVRFSAELGFTIEEKTCEAIINKADLIKNVSAERIRDEINKIILSDHPDHIYAPASLRIFECADINLYVCLSNRPDYLTGYLRGCEKETVLRLSVLFMSAEIEEIKKILRGLRYKNKTVSEIVTLISGLNNKIENDYYAIRKMLSKIGFEMFDKIIYLKKITCGGEKFISELMEKKIKIMNDGDCLSLRGLAVNGTDIAGHTDLVGKQIGEALDYLMDAVLRCPEKNDKEILFNILSQAFSSPPPPSA